MSLFLVIAGLLAAAALAFLLPPLLRARAQPATAVRDDANTLIYREQLAELDAERERGVVGVEAYAQARRELERRIAAEAAAPAREPGSGTQRHRAAALALALFLPLATALGYWQFGNPDALRQAEALKAAAKVTPEQMRELTEQLWERMHAQPDDPQGWMLLGRSLAVFGDHARSAIAYSRATQLAPGNADLLADYADALSMSRGGTLDGEPYALVKRALDLEPENLKALTLAGSAAFQRGEHADAIGYWTRLQALVPPDSELARSVADGLAELRKRAAAPGAASAPRQLQAISGEVRLDPALASRVRPEDAVFVLARPAGGAGMPLAVVRTTVRELPYRFTLDDSMAMAPGAKLSGHAKIVVSARVSRSGNAAPQKGDIEGVADAVAPGTRNLAVVLSRVIE